MANLDLTSSDLKKYSKLVIIVVIGLLAAGAYFLWWPQYQDFKKNSEELANKEEETKLKKEYNRELEGNLNLLLEYEEKISKIETALPERFSIASLINFIQSKNTENGLILSEINISSEAVSAVSASSAGKTEKIVSPGGFTIQKVNFGIIISGSYSSFKDFLSSVWKNSRMIDINSISFVSPEEGSIFDFDLEITASYYGKAAEE